MGKNVLIDTGPLVAALRGRDVHHAWARAHFEAATEPFATCEAVISESLFLLERARDGKEALCGLIERGIVVVRYSFDEELAETLRLVRRYSDTPMSFADACLVRMAEKRGDTVVFTTDSDFRTYRRNGRQVIPLIIPE
ncbi:MAG TPA: PIN domain-containing protein [Chthoniobacter sp.]|jgi:predicted nucleic acid-binding protein